MLAGRWAGLLTIGIDDEHGAVARLLCREGLGPRLEEMREGKTADWYEHTGHEGWSFSGPNTYCLETSYDTRDRLCKAKLHSTLSVLCASDASRAALRAPASRLWPL